MRVAPVLEQKDPLPSTQLHLSACDRDRFARARQRHPNVRRHIVGAFVIVFEVLIFRDELVEKSLEIAPGRGRGVFHRDQAATGVLNKYRDRSIAHATLFDLTLDLIRDLVGALSVRLDGKILVFYSHSSRA